MKKHPQDVAIDIMIDKICTNKYGSQWASPKDSEKRDISLFDKSKKAYGSREVKHNIKFEDYEQEI